MAVKATKAHRVQNIDNNGNIVGGATDTAEFTKITDGIDTALVTASGSQNTLDDNSADIKTEKYATEKLSKGYDTVICGHTHRRQRYSFQKNSIIKIYCGGMATSLRQSYDTTFDMLDIKVNNNEIIDISGPRYSWDYDKDNFVKADC